MPCGLTNDPGGQFSRRKKERREQGKMEGRKKNKKVSASNLTPLFSLFFNDAQCFLKRKNTWVKGIRRNIGKKTQQSPRAALVTRLSLAPTEGTTVGTAEISSAENAPSAPFPYQSVVFNQRCAFATTAT
jgi:hypothetical protein